jgi:uncharacterized protein YlxW (UPF0749 family)
MMERPGTSAGTNKVRELENELKNEQKLKKKLADEIESLKKEIYKSNFQSFTSNVSEVSVTAGRLPMVPGVREISLEDLQFGE